MKVEKVKEITNYLQYAWTAGAHEAPNRHVDVRYSFFRTIETMLIANLICQFSQTFENFVVLFLSHCSHYCTHTFLWLFYFSNQNLLCCFNIFLNLFFFKIIFRLTFSLFFFSFCLFCKNFHNFLFSSQICRFSGNF